MTKKILLAAVLALLAAPSAAAEERPGPGDKAGKETRAERQVRKAAVKQATRHCVELKQQLGRAAFTAAYPSFRDCMLARLEAERANRSEAKAECLAELEKKAKHGKRGKAKRLAACTAKKAAEDSALEREQVVNAAKACADELASDPAAFRAEYGANHNLANAFGKCVSAKAGATDDADERKDEEGSEDEDEEHEDEHGEDEQDGESDDGDVVEDDEREDAGEE